MSGGHFACGADGHGIRSRTGNSPTAGLKIKEKN